MRYQTKLLAASSLLFATPIAAQETPTAGVATSSVGEAGMRQTSEQAAEQAGQTVHSRRLDLRINSRVQNRIRNRVDRDYAPPTGSTSSYQAAGSRLRDTGQPRQR